MVNFEMYYMGEKFIYHELHELIDAINRLGNCSDDFYCDIERIVIQTSLISTVGKIVILAGKEVE